MKKTHYSAISYFLAAIMFLSLFSFSTIASAQEPSASEDDLRARLPEWLSDDAPLPDPDSEITTIYFYIDEDNTAVICDPDEVISSEFTRTSVSSTGGTATIYWVNHTTVFWSVSTNAGSYIYFHGALATNNACYQSLNKLSTDGIVDGQVTCKTKKNFNNVATLNGYSVDAWGVSVTLPSVSAHLYY